MKRLTVILMLAVVLYGCDPGYNCYVRNDASSILYLKTHPSIESQVDAQSIVYDSVLAFKVQEEGKLSVYKIEPYGVFRIYGRIGNNPSIQEMPFDYIEIIQGSDTIVLDSKQKILERLKQEGKTRRYFISE